MGKTDRAYLQGQLFPLEVARPQKQERPKERITHRLDRSRVTRDEAVALAYERTQQAQHEVKLGLAQALGRLSPDKRQALREKLFAPRRVA